MPTIATPAALSTAGNIITSIRMQIPDPSPNNDPSLDGNAFTSAQLIQWLNDAGRVMCTLVPCIQDWGGFQSAQGMDVYVLPSYVVSVEQAWYDLQPLTRSPELDDLFTSKIVARSWWFGPHSLHATPRLHVWPACDRTGSVTTITGAMTATDSTFTLGNTAGFKTYGFVTVDTELILYRSINSSSGVITNILRGQGGTVAAAHNSGATATENNVFYKCSRLPNPLTSANDIVEVPQGLWPLLELFVISRVREAEQEYQAAKGLRDEFNKSVEALANKAQMKGLHQGIQVRINPPGPDLYGGRVYIP